MSENNNASKQPQKWTRADELHARRVRLGEIQEEKTFNKMRFAVIALIVLAVMVVLILLCGCGFARNTEDPAAGEAAVQEDDAAAEAAPEPTPSPVPELAFPDGAVHAADETSLDLSSLTHADVAKTAELLKLAGYSLSPSDSRELVLRFCLENRIYDIFSINCLLEAMGAKELK